MRITVAMGLGLALAADGLLMLFDPTGWYALAPGVPETGPLNPHFVRDIGCAYILTGLALAGLAFNERAWPAALIGALFLTLHALVHVADGFSGRVHAIQSWPTWSPCMRRPRSLSGLSFCPPPSHGVCPCWLG
jgi:hypothetical protein